jgi:hypothetical protein
MSAKAVTALRKNFALQEAQDAALGDILTTELSPAHFIKVGLDLEQQQ